ncbi:hypothetical protein ZWY2020_058173 [Hordeum vulgare]|nr:hypothetical protein ZWY2020_058173 [Hordeum vulgare]
MAAAASSSFRPEVARSPAAVEPPAPPLSKFKVALCQLSVMADKALNIARNRPAIESATADGAKLVLLPMQNNHSVVHPKESWSAPLRRCTLATLRGFVQRCDIGGAGGESRRVTRRGSRSNREQEDDNEQRKAAIAVFFFPSPPVVRGGAVGESRRASSIPVLCEKVEAKGRTTYNEFDDLQNIKLRNETLQSSAENVNGIRLPFVLVKITLVLNLQSDIPMFTTAELM